MDMIATIIHSNSKSLLVRDLKTNDEVIVFSHDVRSFTPGDCVRIKFDGKMTHGVALQITATSIWEIECPD